MGDVSGDYYGGVHGGAEEDERVRYWEAGLPKLDDLTPLTQGLIPADLLSAFNIRPVPSRTSGDVSRASHDTISAIQGSNFKSFEENLEEIDEEEEEEKAEEEGSDSKKARRNESPEDVDSAVAKALKRPRLVWTPQLHKRFVDVVAHLGIKNAVPKTIMQLMNVEGLTRENVASHLQKYRLYLKRIQGVSFDAPAEQLFASTPAPTSLPENGNGSGHVGMPIPVPYGPPMMPMPVPMMGTGHGHMNMGMGTGMTMGNYNGFGSHPNNHHNNNNNHFNHHHNHYHHYQYGSMMNYHHHHPPHVAPGGDN